MKGILIENKLPCGWNNIKDTNFFRAKKEIWLKHAQINAYNCMSSLFKCQNRPQLVDGISPKTRKVLRISIFINYLKIRQFHEQNLIPWTQIISSPFPFTFF